MVGQIIQPTAPICEVQVTGSWFSALVLVASVLDPVVPVASVVLVVPLVVLPVGWEEASVVPGLSGVVFPGVLCGFCSV